MGVFANAEVESIEAAVGLGLLSSFEIGGLATGSLETALASETEDGEKKRIFPKLFPKLRDWLKKKFGPESGFGSARHGDNKSPTESAPSDPCAAVCDSLCMSKCGGACGRRYCYTDPGGEIQCQDVDCL